MNRILLKNPKNSFTKGKIWTKTIAMLLLLMTICFNNANAQIAFNVTGNTNTTPNLATSYSSFAATLTALNAVTAITGNVEINATIAGGTEIAPPKGFTIGSTSLNAATNSTPFYIYFNASGTTINAGIGTSTIATNPDGIIKLVGADKIYLNNFKLVDGNTTGAAMMEFGIGLFKASVTDGCNNNQINLNDIAMQRANTFPTSGSMTGGASGIIMVNAIHASATTAVTPTSVAGANSFNTFYNNVIDGGINGMVLSGYNDTSPYTFADYSNQVNSNGIYNFGFDTGATALNAYGIFTTNQFEVKIESNFLDNNNGAGVNQIYNLYGINVTGANATNPLINNNTIELTSGSPNFILIGIQNSSGLSSTVNITYNIIRFGYPNGTTPAAVAVRGISNASVPTTLNINNNTIEGIGGTLIAGSGETNFIINNTTTITPTVNTNNNIIRNFERTGASGAIYCIRILATNWTATGNTIDNIKFLTVGSTGSIYGLTAVASSVNSSLTNNIISNLSIPFAGSIYGIFESGAIGTKVMNNNQIFNFVTSAGGTGGSNFTGLYCGNGTTTLSNNSINSLNISGNDATAASSSVNGVRLLSTTNTLANNKIYDLSANSVFGSVYGIYNASVPATLYNNVISDLRAPNTSSTNGVNGILTSGSLNLYYNTILLNETLKNGANVGSNAVFFNSTGSLISRNNIFINKSVANGIGQATALFCSNFAITYDPSSNNNLLYGTTIFTDGTNSDTTLAAFKTRMATRDQNSVTETITPFISTVGSNAGFLRLPTNSVSVANNNAVPVTSPAITTDYFGVTRSTTTPDIGASEFAGFVCTTPTFTSNPPNRSICAGSNTTFSVAATNATTYQWQVNNGSGFADITNGGVYSGATTATLTIAGATATMSGYLYRAVAINVVNTCFTNSNSGTLFVSNITSVIGSITNVSCFGGSNGVATVIAGGGVGGYTYSWSPSGGTADTATGLTAGSYTVTITDGIGCTATRTFTVTQTSALVLTPASQTNIACNGGATGAAAVNTATGGTAGYTYDWTPGTPTGDGTTSVTGLTAGTWTCTVTDAKGCTRTQSFAVTQPSAIILTSSSQTNIACNGGANGAAGVSPSGGNPGYTYLWSNGATTQSITGLVAGTYSVTVTDAIGCTATRSFTLSQPSPLTTTGSQINLACFGGANGSASVSPSGGTSPYTILWSTGSTSNNIFGLNANTYNVTVTDANSCTATRSFTLTQPTSYPAGATVVTNVSCFGGSNGAINLTPSGGTSPYTFNWGGGITTEDRTGLAAGVYSVTITDANGCVRTVNNIFITQPSSAVSGSTSQTNVACFGGSTGAINLTPAGGTAPYTFNWGGGITTEDRSGLVAGSYSVIITDANGCTATNSYIISQPSAITATMSQTNVSCRAGSNGTATIVASGGAGSYTYSWSPSGGTGATATGLIAGTYTCTVTDANACSISRVYSILQPSAIGATVSQTNVSCNSGTNGAASIAVSGGAGGYSYNWTPGNPTGNGTTSITGLTAGNYICTVTDANSCIATRPFTITQPAALNNSVSQALGVVTASLSTFGTTYQWYQCPNTLLSGETNQTYTPAAAGDYKVEVTLAGCTATSSCITVSTLGNESFAFNSKFTVYPNPFSDVFSLNSDVPANIVVYDLIGKIIKSENIDLGITKLDMSNYPSGIYLMKVTNDSNQTKTMKLIKQ